MLVANGAIGAVTIAACGLLTPAWPLVATCAVLVAAGMSRSMQFTSLNTIAFADIAAEARGGATTMAAMAAQIGSTLGVAFATLALGLAQSLGGGPLSLAHFRIAFLACGALMAASPCGFGACPCMRGRRRSHRLRAPWMAAAWAPPRLARSTAG